MRIIILISRLFVGLLFIFSGFIKANDALGFAYKLEDYYEVFGEYPILSIFDSGLFHSTALELSMFICVLEIVLGVAVIIGALPRLVGPVMLGLIIFFTFLTAFSAITGKVTDCGCFGDAIKLTPWQSFYKDLILLFFIGIIFYYRHKIKPLLTNAKHSYGVLFLGTIIPLIFTLMAYHHLPFIDFRNYKPGNDICELMTLPEGAKQDIYEITYYYKNSVTNEEITLSPQEYNDRKLWEDTTWVYADRKDKLIQKGDLPAIQNFNFVDDEGNDLTEEFLYTEGYKFICVAYDLDKTRTSRIDEIVGLQQQAEQHEINFIGLSASSDVAVNDFRHDHNVTFPFYFTDAIELKTMIRSNPGLILMNDCSIVAKWHWRDIPDWEEIKENYLNK